MSASWQGHEEDVRVQRQRVHAAVRTARPQARILVRRSSGEVGWADIPDLNVSPEVLASSISIKSDPAFSGQETPTYTERDGRV